MKTKHELTTVAQVRAAFWADLSESSPLLATARRSGKRQNDYPATIRTLWCDWLDTAAREGRVSERLAQAVTL